MGSGKFVLVSLPAPWAVCGTGLHHEQGGGWAQGCLICWFRDGMPTPNYGNRSGLGGHK